MFYLKCLCRAYLEVHGKYEGFPYVEELKKMSSEGTDPKDVFFYLVGYRHDNLLSASERFEYRKMSSKDETQKLFSIFKLKDKTDLVEVLEKMDCLSDRGMVRPVKIKDEKFANLVRILADYLMNNEEKIVWQGKEPKFFNEVITPMKYVKNKKEFESILNSDRFKGALKLILPNMVYKKGCTPLISQDVFFVPFNLSSSQIQELIVGAVSHAVTRSLDVPNQVYFHMVHNAVTYQLAKNHVYLRILDWAHSLGMTVKEMFEKCGMAYVDRFEYYERYKVLPYLIGENKVMVYSSNSMTEENCIILNSEQTVKLVNAGCLKTLFWEDGVPHVYLNGKQDLREVFGIQETRDFSKAGGI
jgi:hypothetical protein